MPPGIVKHWTLHETLAALKTASPEEEERMLRKFGIITVVMPQQRVTPRRSKVPPPPLEDISDSDAGLYSDGSEDEDTEVPATALFASGPDEAKEKPDVMVTAMQGQ